MSTSEYSLTGGRLIDGTGRDAVDDAVVVVKDGRFSAVGPRSLIAPPEGIPTVDLTGKTIIPGLFDAHVHLGQMYYNRFDVSEPMQLMDDFLRSFPSAGVTSVRCTGSPDLDESFSLLKASRANWPRFFGSGPNLDGEPGGPHPGLRAVTSPEQAAEATRELIEGGADFIKIYAWMRPPEISAVVSVAHARGIRVTAHVGHVVTAREAVALGVDCLEHVRVGPELLSPAQREELERLPRRKRDDLSSFRSWRFIDAQNAGTRKLASELGEAGTFMVPTLSFSQAALMSRLDDEIRNPPGNGEMHEAVLDRWDEREISSDYSTDDLAWAPMELERQIEFVGVAHREGVRLAAGTDVPNPFLVPGLSIHQELALLVQAGLTPIEAIRAATSVPAELLGMGHEIGSVEKTKRADLVVLDNDPTTNIGASREISAVMKDGRWLE